MTGPSERITSDFLMHLFPEVRPAVRDGNLSPAQALDVARDYCTNRWESADCVFVFGSAAHGRTHAYSDVDVLIFLEDVPFASTTREIFDGIPIEAHITCKTAFAKELRQAEATGVPNKAFVVLEGLVLKDPSGKAARYQEAARRVYARGPVALTSVREQYLARSVSKRILDLMMVKCPSEKETIAAALSELLFHVHFVRKSKWRYSGKWSARKAPEFAARLSSALRRATDFGEFAELIEIAQGELAEMGGFRWADFPALNPTMRAPEQPQDGVRAW